MGLAEILRAASVARTAMRLGTDLWELIELLLRQGRERGELTEEEVDKVLAGRHASDADWDAEIEAIRSGRGDVGDG